MPAASPLPPLSDRQDMSADDNFGLWNVKLLSNMGHWYDLGRITLAESALISESSSFYYFDFLLSSVSSSASILASSFRAVDGNRNTDWGGGSCTHTNTESNPWWKLDFGQARSVRSVTVWNRGTAVKTGLTTSTFGSETLHLPSTQIHCVRQGSERPFPRLILRLCPVTGWADTSSSCCKAATGY